jgi:chromosome segregation ATPase
MSGNVNKVIETLNKEALKTNKSPKHSGVKIIDEDSRIRAADREVVTIEKNASTLVKEHNKLKKRLEEVQNPEFVTNLKRQLKNADEEIKSKEKQKKGLV